MLTKPPPAISASSKSYPPDCGSGICQHDLKNVKKRVQLITTNHAGSLGLHPAVYFYARSGNFMPNAFLAAAEFAKRLDDTGQKKSFTDHREEFEKFIFENKIFITLTVTKLGSGSRSLGRLKELFWRVFQDLKLGKKPNEIS